MKPSAKVEKEMNVHVMGIVIKASKLTMVSKPVMFLNDEPAEDDKTDDIKRLQAG